MIQEITLGEADVGEMVVWEPRHFRDVYADVLEQQNEKVVVRADNGITYEWPPTLLVTVDR